MKNIMTRNGDERLVLAIDPAPRGFGYVLFEGPKIPLDWGVAEARVQTSKRSLERIKKMIEFKLKNKNGEDIYLEILPNLVCRDGVPYAIHGIARDITEKKLAELAVQRNEEMLRNVINNVQEYIYNINYEKGEIKSIFHSPKCLDITGYMQDEYSRDPNLWMNMVYHEDRDKVRQFIKDLKKGGSTDSIEQRV